jgi:hypothetical protein
MHVNLRRSRLGGINEGPVETLVQGGAGQYETRLFKVEEGETR